MKLSIITINYNDAEGLKKTVESVLHQTARDQIEYIVIDGGSTDGSGEYLQSISSQLDYWHSKRDKGIYNGMNIGIQQATGDYVQILNAGDILANKQVTERCILKMEELEWPELIYGNMLVEAGEGSYAGSKEIEYSLKQYYCSTMNHDCCWIKRSLFDQYGLYDENLKIVSDWKWWVQAIGLGHVHPIYVDIDMTIFQGGGISSTQLDLRNQERRQVLEELLPPAILADYDTHAFGMQQIDRLKKHHLYGLVYFIERVLFKLEKWHILK